MGGPDLGGTTVSTKVISPPVSRAVVLMMSRSPKTQKLWPPPGGTWTIFDGSWSGFVSMPLLLVMGLRNVSKLEEIHDRDRFDHAFQKVAAEGSAVAQADHDVAMHVGLAILASDLAHEA